MVTSIRQVLDRLEEALLNGSFPANSKLPSERELAERYGVSRNTVREAIQQLGRADSCASGRAAACSCRTSCARARRRPGAS